MASSRKRRIVDPAVPVRHLIVLDTENVLRRLLTRQDEMVRLFSRLRDRTPLLTTVESWFSTITFEQLALLLPHEQRAVNTFYDLLAELRWYLQYTEDMPGSVQQTLAVRVRQLQAESVRMLSVLAAAGGGTGPVVEAEVVGDVALARVASGRRSRRG